MNIKTKKLSLTAVGVALFVVLSLCLQVPVFENYYLCLGYLVMAVYLYSFGTLSGTLVGVLGVVLYCVLISGLRGMPGWSLGNLVIGILLGTTFRKTRNLSSKTLQMIIHCAVAVAATAFGILAVKSEVEHLLYMQPFLVRVGKNMTAFIADAVMLILSLPFCRIIDRYASKIFPEICTVKRKPSKEIQQYVQSHYLPDQPLYSRVDHVYSGEACSTMQIPAWWPEDSHTGNQRNGKDAVSDVDEKELYSVYPAAGKGTRKKSYIESGRPASFHPLEFRKPSSPYPLEEQEVIPEDLKREIDKLMSESDSSFQQKLFEEIDNRGMSDVECYKRAHMDRKVFSKIRNDEHYQPKKTTAVALAMALHMNRPELDDLIGRAGFALSNNNYFDVIIQYFVENRQYDLFKINEILYYYDQPLLGSW